LAVSRDVRDHAASQTPSAQPPAAPNLEAPSSAPDVEAILTSIGEAAYVWRLDSDTLGWGPNACAILNVADVAQIGTGRSYARWLGPENQVTRFDAVTGSTTRDVGAGVPYQIQYCRVPASADASKIWIEDTGRWFAGPDGKPVRAHGVVRIVNERHAKEERLAYLSRCDDLTGEMNRFRLTEMLAAALDEAVRFRASCGFLSVAIDDLARINEAYGLAAADEVIGAVAKRIRVRMRVGDSLGRFAGNRFGVVLRNCTTQDLAAAADRLLAVVRDDVIQTSAGAVAASVTIGGVAAPRHARNVEEILSRAQEALDAAKTKRRGSFEAYRPNVERDARRRENVRATDEIIAALNDRRILLAFEPVVDIRSRELAFYECLMRIRRRDGSLIAAGDVIPAAERLGLVRLVDHRALELVIGEMAAAPELRASLNLSSASTTDPDWWSSLGSLLRTHPGVAKRLILEITESTAIHNIDETRGFVARAKDLGCRIAIDDFGAGYTSFRNLRKLGVDIIKIDGSFVQNLVRSEDDRVFVRTLIDLGRGLGLETVAEWVGDEATAAMLAGWGCHYIQGVLPGMAALERPGAAAGSGAASA